MRKIKILKKPITIEKIETLRFLDTMYWIDFENIIGIDHAKIRRMIKNEPDCMIDNENQRNYGFEISHFFLENYLQWHHTNDFVSELSQELPKILQFASKVARNLYTFSPAFNIIYAAAIITKENIHECLSVAKEEYSTANECEKIYLSVLYLQFFDNIFCLDYKGPDCIPLKYFNEEDRAFLSEIEELGRDVLFDHDGTLQKNCSEK